MKRFIKSLLLFIPFAAFIYCLLLLGLTYFIPFNYLKNVYTLSSKHAVKRLDEVKKTNDIDVLFLGSSHAFRSFDTRLYKNVGLKSFNLGSSAQTPLQTQYLLEQYLDSLKPKLVVYEVYPVTFSIDGIEASMYLMGDESVNKGIFNLALEQNSIIVYNTMLLSLLEQQLGMDIKKSEKKQERYIPGGFVESKLKYFNRKPRPKETLKFIDAQFDKFEQNLELLKKRNIRYILVQAPYPKTTYRAFTNMKDFDNRISKYGKYYNFNEIMNLDDSINYLDDSHLNQNGVLAFNKQLIDSLKANNNQELWNYVTSYIKP